MTDKKPIEVEIEGIPQVLQFEPGTSQEVIQKAVQRVVKSRDFMTQEPETFSTPKRDFVKDSGLEAAGKYLYNNKFDLAGGVAGGMTGAGLGTAVAPGPGTVVGGMTGGIIGATVGKELDELAGTRPDHHIATNAVISTGEEIGGRAIGAVAKPVVNLVDSGIQKAFGFSRTPRTIDDVMLRESDINPLDTGRTIQSAQENVLDERLLTVFEETGGRAGQGLQAMLDEAATVSKRNSSLASEFVKTRREVNTRILEKIRPGGKPASSQGLELAVKEAATSSRKILGDQLNTLDEILVKGRGKVQIPVGDIDSDFGNAIKFIRAKLSPDKADQMIGVFNKYFIDKNPMNPTMVPKGTYKTSISLEDLKKFENEIQQDVIGKFLPGQSAQKPVAGVYSDHIKPILKEHVANYKNSLPEGAAERRIMEAQELYDGIATQKKFLENSTIARKLGITDAKQQLTAKEGEKLDRLIFDTVQSWRETEEILDISDPTGALREELVDRFKSNIIEKAWDAKTKEFTFEKLNSQMSKYGDDIIKEVVGPEYLQSLKDSRLITLAMKSSQSLVDGKPVLGADQRLFENLRRIAVHPLAGRVGFVQGLTTKLRKGIGLGNVTDEHIMKMMQGERGKLIVEKAMNVPFSDPSSYNVYVQAVRELTKMGADVTLLNREAYLNGMSNGLSEVINNMEQAQ